MRVAFISRATLYSAPGGDTKQLDLTAEYLRQLGVAVDIYKASDEIAYSKYDLLHFFNIIRPANILKHIRKSGKPYVISTIFVDYGKVTAIGKVQKLLKQFLSDDTMEYIKAIARAVKNGEKIVSPEYILKGHRASIKYIIRNASILLPNSSNEYSRLYAKYGVTAQFRIIPNGINIYSIRKEYASDDKYKNAVICMARIEPMKNQLNLIRALNGTPYQLYIHGKPSPNGADYYQQCKDEAAANVHIEGHLGEDALFAAYSNARVHVLPSYFETTGLSSLEAAVMGCNIVITDRGDTRDYFKNDAWYCEPDDVDSIRDAVVKAYDAPFDENFRKRILENYTWQRAAEETLAAYKQVLKV